MICARVRSRAKVCAACVALVAEYGLGPCEFVFAPCGNVRKAHNANIHVGDFSRAEHQQLTSRASPPSVSHAALLSHLLFEAIAQAVGACGRMGSLPVGAHGLAEAAVAPFAHGDDDDGGDACVKLQSL